MPSIRWGRVFYVSTYYFLIIGIGLSLLVTGYDLVQQTLSLARGGGKYFYIFILVGTYVAIVLGLLAGIIALARLYTVRKALSDIPKRYMPIKKLDVPNPVHKLISTELTRSAIIRHSTLPTPSHPGLSPPDHPHFPSTSYTPIILHSAILIMSKASRFHRSLTHRKNETLRQYILRVRDEGLWRDDVTREGLMVWLDKYEAVRFQGVELSESEFLNTMKLVYFLLLEMKPPDKKGEDAVSMADSSSSASSGDSLYSNSERSFYSGGEGSLLRQTTTTETMEGDVLRQMETLLSSPRRSGESGSVGSMIDHGSVMENVMDEEHERRMRGGRLGEREGSVIYYDS